MALIIGDDNDNNLAGTNNSDSLAGNGGDDFLRAGAGDDFVSGDDGNDILMGGPGLDLLMGGSGADLYVLDTLPVFDIIRDRISGALYGGNVHADRLAFDSGVDRIVLVKAVNLYENVPLGLLAEDMLHIGPGLKTALDNDDFFIYDSTAGILYYDNDANGPAEALDIATIGFELPLVASDIQVISLNSVTGTTGDDNLVGTAGPDVLAGGSGNDTLHGDSSVDNLLGGPGRDVALYAGARADYSITTNIPWTSTVVDINIADGNDGIDSTQFVERLRFNDMSVALDVANMGSAPYWDSNAGEVAKTIGAVFGKAMVNDLTFAGLGLYHRDRADSYEALMQLALTAKLGVNASNRQVVDLLYTNVVGTAPSENVAQQYVNMLINGTYTQAGLGVFAADTAENAANIDLAGLRIHGLAFYEYL